MATAADLVARFFDEVGSDVGELAREEEVLGWINAGIGRLPARYPLTSSVSWTSGSSQIVLPDDYVRFDRVEVSTGYLQPYALWGKVLRFFDPLTISGSGVIFYYSRFPEVSGAADSVLPPPGEEAVVAYACYRFFRKLAASRADYRKYVTVTGQSGLDVSDLDAVAERYRQDFVDARAELEETDLDGPASFFGE